MYAGASGDMNPLHYDQDFAGQVSPTGGIIAHGMYSMGLASRLLTAFAGGPEQVLEVAGPLHPPVAARHHRDLRRHRHRVEDGVATVEWGTQRGRRPDPEGHGRVRL
jgi:acyl dehydratase